MSTSRHGRPMRRIRSALVVIPATLVGLVLVADVPLVHGASANGGYFAPYLALIKEVDVRRRVNVLHPNPQSLLDGLQVGFVNVGSGNLTFLRRDLVIDGESPLILGRVYDSRLTPGADFGPGWRLSLMEELHFDAAGVVYADGSGSEHRFRLSGGGYVPIPMTPRHARTTVVREGDRARLDDGRGVVRHFKRHGSGSRFLIDSLQTAAGGKVRFGYNGEGQLEQVWRDDANGFDILRGGDKKGRITSVTDTHGRTVRYSYTANGQLKDVRDIGDQVWWHE